MNLPRIFFGHAFLKICILFLILAVHLIGSSMAIAETKNAAHQNQQVYTKDEKEFVKAFLQVLNAAKDKREQLSSEALVYIDAGVLPKSLNWEMIVAMSAIQPTPYKYPTGKKLREFFDRQNKNFISDFEFYQRHVSKIRPLNWGGVSLLQCNKGYGAAFDAEQRGQSLCSFFDIAVRHFWDEDSFVWLSNLEGIDLNSPEAEAAYERLFQLFPERLDIRAMRRLVARGYNFDRSFSMRNLQSGWSKSFYRDHENLGFTEVISSMFCLENNPKCEEVCRVMNGNTPFSLEKSGDFFIPFIRDQAKKSLRNLKGPQSVGPECTEFLKFQIKSKPGVLAELKREALKARAPNSIKYFEALATQSETFWATKVLGFSSEYDAQGWSATQALGKPNVSVCGDFRGSWAQKNNPNEWIKVGFERTLVPEKVKIYQNNEVGFVREIVLWNADGSKKEIPVSDPTTNCPGVLEVFVGDHGLPITALTVHVDGSHRSGFEEIDAIAIVGNASGP